MTMKTFNKGDWVRFTSPFFATQFDGNLFDPVSIEGRTIKPDHFDHLREGIVVEALSPHVVQVLYIGDNSPKRVLVKYLKKIENENE